MRISSFRGSALGAAAVAVALLAGCSGNSSQTGNAGGFGPATPQHRQAGTNYRHLVASDGSMSVLPAGFKPNLRRPAWMKTAPDGSNNPGLAVAQFGTDTVLWFKKSNHKNKPPAACEPASSTNGIRVDRDGNLWIPDGRANTTTKYAPNCGASLLTIPDPTGEPADVALDPSGNVYILNLNNISGPPEVNAYNSSTGALLRTLTDPSFNVLFGVGSDRNGNVFVSNLTTNNVGNVIEFPKGKMPGKALSGIHLGLPGTPALDSKGNMVISDWLNGTIDVFAPPYTGAPATSALMGQSIWCPLNKNQKRIYCGDAENGSIDVYAYPGGAYIYSYTASLSASELVTGVSPSPALPY